MKEESEQPVILVSKDTNVRIKADILKVKAEDYKHEMIDEDHLRYNGRNEILLTDKDFQKLLQGTPIELKIATPSTKPSSLVTFAFPVTISKDIF